MFSFFVIRNFEKDELIIRENDTCQFMYFILRGEVEMSKSFTLEIPKKMIKDENKPSVDKEIEVKVSRLSEKCYLGEVEYFLHSHNREFTATAT